jgi:hypothetical protein
MTKPSYKELITETVLNQLKDKNWTQEEAMKKWWMTVRSDRGLRLTDIGDMSFRYADLEFYEYKLTMDKEQSMYFNILELSKKIKCPYYLGVNKIEGKKSEPYIRLYDSRIAIMISLYGNILDYLKSLKERT